MSRPASPPSRHRRRSGGATSRPGSSCPTRCCPPSTGSYRNSRTEEERIMSLLTKIIRGSVIAASALALAGGMASAQDQYPSRPITLIVPYTPGGGTDLTTRALAMAAQDVLGQPISVVNKPSGGGAAA